MVGEAPATPDASRNLKVFVLAAEDTAALANLAARSMNLQVNIQDGEVSLSDDQGVVSLTPELRL